MCIVSSSYADPIDTLTDSPSGNDELTLYELNALAFNKDLSPSFCNKSSIDEQLANTVIELILVVSHAEIYDLLI
jgi:hypothetical protein